MLELKHGFNVPGQFPAYEMAVDLWSITITLQHPFCICQECFFFTFVQSSSLAEIWAKLFYSMCENSFVYVGYG